MFADRDGKLVRRESQIQRVLSTLRRQSELGKAAGQSLPQFKTHGEYTVTKVLRQGSTAEVYVAEDQEGREWVLKRFLADSTDNTVWQDYLLQKVVGEHPRIVSIKKDALESQRHVCLVMEYVQNWQTKWHPGDSLACCVDFEKKEVLVGVNGDWAPPFGVCFRGSTLPSTRAGSWQPLLPFVRGRRGVAVRVNFGTAEKYGKGKQYQLPPGWTGDECSVGGEVHRLRGSAESTDGVWVLGATDTADSEQLTTPSDILNGPSDGGCAPRDCIIRSGRRFFEVTVVATPESGSLAVGFASPDACDEMMQNEVYLVDGLRCSKLTPAGSDTYLTGNDVDDLVNCGPLPPRRAVRWYRDLMEALAHCHAHGIAHRDVKGQNLFVCGASGVAKLGDFGGGAKDADTKKCFETAGTPGRMAPELWQSQLDKSAGKGGYWAFPADVWASGVTLYEMLTGRGLVVQPWEQITESDIERVGMATLAFTVDKLPPEEKKVFQSLPPEAQMLLRRILDPNPDKRPTASQILENSWLADEAHEPFLTCEDACRPG
eukprot:TRINITY_DN4243_c0_g1_i1.p1 TRINITY_DN4243_c0_g1~~TRINITY_DN4243_c0_g1_i1.p1  ORF type:complete len:612 (+),score=162.85 TRINITY_DN4243_c0_g1_i1:205-1836(+)